MDWIMEDKQKKGIPWVKIIISLFVAFVLVRCITIYFARVPIKQNAVSIQNYATSNNPIDLQNIPEGMYAVGKDIPPGEYKIEATSTEGGFFNLYSSSDPTTKNYIIENGPVSGQKYLTVQSGQFLEIQRAQMSKVN